MEREEQDGWTLNPGFNQPRALTVRAEETSPPQTTEAFKSRKKQNVSPCHAVIGARPFCSPEYSPDFHKLGSTLPRSTYGTRSHIKADTSISLQPSTKTRVLGSEKKRLLDKQEEMEEVKQLDEWRPAAGVFTAALQGLEDKTS